MTKWHTQEAIDQAKAEAERNISCVNAMEGHDPSTAVVLSRGEYEDLLAAYIGAAEAWHHEREHAGRYATCTEDACVADRARLARLEQKGAKG